VEVPEAGKAVTAGGEAGVVESVKAASEIYSPVTGEVVEGNEALGDDPALVNSAPMDGGWIFKVKLSDPAEMDGLMTEADYKAFVDGLE
jgi:glycine cleavage system H protein